MFHLISPGCPRPNSALIVQKKWPKKPFIHPSIHPNFHQNLACRKSRGKAKSACFYAKLMFGVPQGSVLGRINNSQISIEIWPAEKVAGRPNQPGFMPSCFYVSSSSCFKPNYLSFSTQILYWYSTQFCGNQLQAIVIEISPHFQSFHEIPIQ